MYRLLTRLINAFFWAYAASALAAAILLIGGDAEIASPTSAFLLMLAMPWSQFLEMIDVLWGGVHVWTHWGMIGSSILLNLLICRGLLAALRQKRRQRKTKPHRSERAAYLEKFLNIFTEVRTGEATSALLLAFNIFLILSAYYVLKPVREALILSSGGAEVKSYAAAGQAILLLVAIPLYSWLANHVSRRLLINAVTFFFIGCLLVFFVLHAYEVPLGVVFFLWVGIFNLMVPAQFWAFANDIYTPEAGKRLFVIVAFGASLGAVTGSYIDSVLIASLGVYKLMLVAAGILASSLVVTHVVEYLEHKSASTVAKKETVAQDDTFSKAGAFSMVLQNRYLLLIAVLMLLLNWVNTTGEYILGKTVLANAEALVNSGQTEYTSVEAYIGGFYANLYSVVNILGVVLQLFVVSRLLKYLGVRVAVLILPIIAMGGYMLAAFYPVLEILRMTKTAENATDYSVQNTVRQVLFLPTTREEKYKAKQAIDTFFVRSGDVLSAGLIFAGTSYWSMNTQQFAMVNSALVVVWMVVGFYVGSRYQALTRE